MEFFPLHLHGNSSSRDHDNKIWDLTPEINEFRSLLLGGEQRAALFDLIAQRTAQYMHEDVVLFKFVIFEIGAGDQREPE